ncbi:hypothetical protein I317_01605 [Kwoniella heveanensis CBS 569]|uniref:Uncharacterized protein n=1 Tax=Kwoniella heveanensis BCC8398 TaxID=1296120 RepID=A0A1B9GIY8_9TREE|nr:hypothetical protein I316_07420 [Kwoniella heveanensis BCC8398]OCF44533.1 hypothetical protein I317_01605 [Kwoniella heveanensis CBS 569]
MVLLARLSPVQTGGGLTHGQAVSSGVASLAGAALSLFMCTFVMATTGWIWSHKSCRHLLDRVSFRLLLWSMFCEFWYAVLYLFLYADPSIFSPGHRPGPNLCTPSVYFMLACMDTVNFFVTCIAINLFLTICMGLNPIQLKLERYYIAGSITLGHLFPLIPAALRRFTWDTALGNCWTAGHGREKRTFYLLTSVYLAPIASCFVSIVCVGITLVVLFRQGRATSRALFAGSGGQLFLDKSLTDSSGSPLSTESMRSGTIGGQSQMGESDGSAEEAEAVEPTWIEKQGEKVKNLVTGKGWRTVEEVYHKKTTSEFNSLSDKFLGIAIKISWYPITLVFINVILIGRHNNAFWFYTIYVILYGGRGTLIAGLILFIDPSLIRGVKAAWIERKAAREPMLPVTKSTGRTVEPTLDALTPASFGPSPTLMTPPSTSPMAPTVQRSRVDSGASFDLFSALNSMPPPGPEGGSKKEYVPRPPHSAFETPELERGELDWDRTETDGPGLVIPDFPAYELEHLKNADESDMSQKSDSVVAEDSPILQVAHQQPYLSPDQHGPITAAASPIRYPPPSAEDHRALSSAQNELPSPVEQAEGEWRAPSQTVEAELPRRGILSRLRHPHYPHLLHHHHHHQHDHQHSNGHPKPPPRAQARLQLPPGEEERERERSLAAEQRKDARRKKEERLKEIKRRFEEVQTHL